MEWMGLRNDPKCPPNRSKKRTLFLENTYALTLDSDSRQSHSVSKTNLFSVSLVTHVLYNTSIQVVTQSFSRFINFQDNHVMQNQLFKTGNTTIIQTTYSYSIKKSINIITTLAFM